MVEELRFTGPRVTPDGVCFEGYGDTGVYHFVLPREALGALSGRRPRMRDLLNGYRRWREHIYEVAERLAAGRDPRRDGAPIVITDDALISTPIEVMREDEARPRAPAWPI